MADGAAVARQLRRVARFSAVLDQQSAPVPFLVEGVQEAGGPAEDVIAANEAVLIHYAFAEDHGCWVTVFDGSAECVQLALTRGDDAAGLVDAWRALRTVDGMNDLVAELPFAIEGEAGLATMADVRRFKDAVVEAMALRHVDWLSCADLTYQSQKALKHRFSACRFFQVKRRGKPPTPEQPEPNEWCPVPDLPEFMYWPVPAVTLDTAREALVDRHLHYWETTTDWDDEAQEGFWMYTAYTKSLPVKYRYLADRLMNMTLAFPEGRRAAFRATLRAIIGVTDPGIDWEPILTRAVKAPVRL
jgi:hypothetical protein